MNQSHRLTLGMVTVLGVLAACGPDDESPEQRPTPPRWTGEFPERSNVLLIIADDYGVDSSPDYDHVPTERERLIAETPNISRVCGEGVRFDHAWSLPTCSPTRASIFTGRYAFRTGIGSTTPPGPPIRHDEVTIPRVLVEHAPYYAHANIGKWHLGVTGELGGSYAPNVMGWDYYAGAVGGHLTSFFRWPRTVQGKTTMVEDYATTRNVDDAITWISGRREGEPWVMWLAFNAPHKPFHLPPNDLHSFDLPPDEVDEYDNEYYMAMVQAMDTEIGRLFQTLDQDGDGLPDDTDVIFVGDNGTPRNTVQRPYSPDKAKATPYEGGVHVPLCIAGPSVQQGGRVVDGLVSTVDLFSTILEMAGVDPAAAITDVEIDSVSLMPYLNDPGARRLRRWVYTEKFGEVRKFHIPGRAIRDERYKYIRRGDGTQEGYDLLTDPLEKKNLLDAEQIDITAIRRLEILRTNMDDLLCDARSRFCGR